MEPAQKGKYENLFYTPNSSIAIVWFQFLIGVGIYAISYYLFDDGLGEWDITSSNMAKAIIAMLLLPFGLILWQSAIFRLSSHSGYHWLFNFTFLLVSICAVFAVGGIYFVVWDLQQFLQWDYDFDSEIPMVQAIYLVLTLWLTGITLFHVLLRLILQRNLYSPDAAINGGGGVDAENQPLIQSEMTGLTATSTADDKNNNKKSSKRPINKMDRELEETSNRFFQYASIFLFFFVFIPIFLWINSVMVSDWHRMTPNTINSKLASWSLTDTWNSYFSFQCLDSDTSFASYTTCYARLYYDILYWYQFVFWVALFSYIVHKSDTLKLFVRKRVMLNIVCPYGPSLISITIGEIIFWILWLVMMILVGYYFMTQHLFDDDSSKTALEKWARYIGILAVQFLAMMLFTITRIRLWIDCFAVSFEHLVAYHRILAVCMLFCGYLHMILWIRYWCITVYDSSTGEYYIDGNLPFGSIPFTYHDDNWTPIMMYYVMLILVPIVYFIGTFELVRRKYFELFYYSHLCGAVIFVGAILWHGSQAWRYIIPPLALYAIDRMIRLANSSRICRVENLSVSVDGVDNDNNIEVTKFAVSIGHYSVKYGESSFKNMNFKMGQYAFLNISNISLYEWHPFTIASGEDENESYFEIQNEGPRVSNNYGAELTKNAQWSTLLYILAQQVGAQEKESKDIEVHIDGPYGKPFDYAGYERVILVAGGIGITPCHSIFSTILSRSIKYGGRDNAGAILPFIDLIWMAKDNKMFSMFTSTWRSYEDHNQASNNKFSVRLFATRPGGNRQDLNEEKQNDDDTEFNHVVPHTDATMYTYGRPNLPDVLQIIKDNDNNPNKTLVFACGPPKLTDDVERVSVKYGAQFYSESFQF